jgi:chloramphenicol-sensitive protein RarD
LTLSEHAPKLRFAIDSKTKQQDKGVGVQVVEQHQHGTRRYVLYGIVAYGLWGLLPLYFKAVSRVAPAEVLAHRAFWSFVVLAILVRLLGRWREVWQDLHRRQLVRRLGFSALLIAVNWLAFIYATETGQVLQASLAYFIGPLLNVLLGVLLFRERLWPFQILSIGIAGVGLLLFAGLVGQMPWIALTMGITGSLYGVIRKTMPVDGLVSLTVETLVMAPVALAYLGFLAARSEATAGSPGILGLLMLAGPITSVPFLLFGSAARQLQLSTMGILQYLAPTIQFILAVAIFREPFAAAQLASFACIWIAVAIYLSDSYRAARQARAGAVEPVLADL